VELLTEASAKRKDDSEVLYYLGEARYQLKQEQAMNLRLPANLTRDASRVLAECTDNISQRDKP